MEISNLSVMMTYLNHGIFIFKLSLFFNEVIFLLSTQAQMKLSFISKKLEEALKANIFNKVYAKTLYLLL